jgi:hypothetical protein
LAAGQLAEAVVVGQLIGDGGKAADGYQGITPQRDGCSEGESAGSEQGCDACGGNKPVVDEEGAET